MNGLEDGCGREGGALSLLTVSLQWKLMLNATLFISHWLCVILDFVILISRTEQQYEETNETHSRNDP